MPYFMNSEDHRDKDVRALFINCQIISILKLFILIPIHFVLLFYH